MSSPALSTIENLDNFKEILQNVISNLYIPESSTSHTNDMINTFKEEVRNILISCDFDKNIVVKYLNEKGWSGDRIDCFVALFEDLKNKLLYHTLLNYNASHGESIMNFDWSIKLVLGSSELKALRYPITQLAFSLLTSIEHIHNFRCELNKNMLATLIDILEASLT